MDQYFKTIKNRHLPNKIPTGDLIGTRKLLQNQNVPRGKMVEYLATEFFSRLMDSFDDFKDYCEDNDEDPECGILKVQDSEVAQIVEKLRDFF